MIDKYFSAIEKTIKGFDIIEKIEIITQTLNSRIGIIEGKLNFKFGILDFLEVIRALEYGKIEKKKYKYHFRLLSNKMIFRYDNMPYHHKLESFPHHKHENDMIYNSTEPDLLDILNEIKNYKPE